MSSSISDNPVEATGRNWRSLLRFLPYLAPHTGRLAAALLFMMASSAGSIIMPYLSRIAIDMHIARGDLVGLWKLGLLALAILALMNLFIALRVRFMAKVGQDTIFRVRQDLFEHLQRIPVSYFDGIPVGKVVTRLTSDVDALSDLVSSAIVGMVMDTLTLAGYLALMIWLDWRLTVITVFTLIPVIFAMTFLSSKIDKAEDNVREQASVVNATSQEGISGMKVIQAFRAQKRFGDKFAKANDGLLQAGIRATSIFAFFWPIVDFAWITSTALTIWFGGRWVLQGTTTAGTLVAFLGYQGTCFGPLRGLSQAYRIIQRAMAGAVRIERILDTKPERPQGDPIPVPSKVSGNLEFDHVWFAYDNDPNTDAPDWVLEDINFNVKPGQTVALVGHTGSGKTSIINLVLRFYAPQKGRILLDGADISQMELGAYRKLIGLVLQDPFLFSGTIRQNLAFGNPEATEDMMWNALSAVGLEELFREKESGLDMVLTERGANLSSGQRQLLSFARALIADTRILILDEATAHVDTMTERKVQAAVAALMRGRTSIVIAHRLSTILNADQILVIDSGRIIERGTHSELLKAKGAYHRLYRAQLDMAR
ncbi:MAG: ABC transporter ATP-binding protein [Firmicutes bacterium]|nr:ABC transporter ATP-binding protein [Bacillota bacterium]